jgi:hypothetical protein
MELTKRKMRYLVAGLDCRGAFEFKAAFEMAVEGDDIFFS